MNVQRKIMFTSFENFLLVLRGFWLWKSCIEVHMYALCDYLPGFISYGSFKSYEVLLTSCSSFFASYLSLIITDADEMIGWQCIEIDAEQTPESSLQLSRVWAHRYSWLWPTLHCHSPFKLFIIPFSWASILYPGELAGVWDRSR